MTSRIVDSPSGIPLIFKCNFCILLRVSGPLLVTCSHPEYKAILAHTLQFQINHEWKHKIPSKYLNYLIKLKMSTFEKLFGLISKCVVTINFLVFIFIAKDFVNKFSEHRLTTQDVIEVSSKTPFPAMSICSSYYRYSFLLI